MEELKSNVQELKSNVQELTRKQTVEVQERTSSVGKLAADVQEIRQLVSASNVRKVTMEESEGRHPAEGVRRQASVPPEILSQPTRRMPSNEDPEFSRGILRTVAKASDTGLLTPVKIKHLTFGQQATSTAGGIGPTPARLPPSDADDPVELHVPHIRSAVGKSTGLRLGIALFPTITKRLNDINKNIVQFVVGDQASDMVTKKSYGPSLHRVIGQFQLLTNRTPYDPSIVNFRPLQEEIETSIGDAFLRHLLPLAARVSAAQNAALDTQFFSKCVSCHAALPVKWPSEWCDVLDTTRLGHDSALARWV